MSTRPRPRKATPRLNRVFWTPPPPRKPTPVTGMSGSAVGLGPIVVVGVLVGWFVGVFVGVALGPGAGWVGTPVWVGVAVGPGWLVGVAVGV